MAYVFETMVYYFVLLVIINPLGLFWSYVLEVLAWGWLKWIKFPYQMEGGCGRQSQSLRSVDPFDPSGRLETVKAVLKFHVSLKRPSERP